MSTKSIATRYGDGAVPCVATMCGECDGMGYIPDMEGEVFPRCQACRGTGRRSGISPFRAAATEVLASFVEPVRFAWFMLNEYGWTEGRPLPALVMVWCDHRWNRRALWRWARAVIRGDRP